MSLSTEKLFALVEARLELNREECARLGHNYRVLVLGTNEPDAVECLRFGLAWPVCVRCGLAWSASTKVRKEQSE